LGECARLVGTDRYSNWPASVQKLPKVGGGLDPSLEAIVALRPDLVLAATSARSATRLESLGIPVAALEPRNLKDMQRVFASVGQLLGKPDNSMAWNTLVNQVAQITHSVPENQKHTRIYVEVNRGPYGASESSFIGEILTQLGMDNIVPGHLGPFPKLNPEFIVRANPDLIMVGDQESEGLTQRPGWSAIKAVRDKRICTFTSKEGDILVRAGPRMAEAARLMMRCIAEKTPQRQPPITHKDKKP
jgi:iron complex transport system substrate-binding protein